MKPLLIAVFTLVSTISATASTHPNYWTRNIYNYYYIVNQTYSTLSMSSFDGEHFGEETIKTRSLITGMVPLVPVLNKINPLGIYYPSMHCGDSTVTPVQDGWTYTLPLETKKWTSCPY